MQQTISAHRCPVCFRPTVESKSNKGWRVCLYCNGGILMTADEYEAFWGKEDGWQ